jgi:hypothetical protein
MAHKIFPFGQDDKLLGTGDSVPGVASACIFTQQAVAKEFYRDSNSRAATNWQTVHEVITAEALLRSTV